jgi:RNA polymerase sigma factor (TIGR02999 family)
MAHRSLLSQRPDQTLNTTSLVHETFLKLFDRAHLDARDRKHFFCTAAMAMRQIIIDNARRHLSQKRGGKVDHVDLDNTDIPIHDRAYELVALDDALTHLQELDERLGRVVELRFFGGLTVEETAEILDVDARTVKRDWRKARAVLYLALQGESGA